MLNIFSYVYWPSVCPLWRSIYSGPLPILLIGFFLVLSFLNSFFFPLILLLFKYSSLTFPLTPAYSPALPTSLPFPPPTPSPVIVHVSFIIVPTTLFPWNSLLSPLWSLSAFSQFQCLWLYFACLFVLLIRFLLKVRSYGICLSPSYFA